MHTFIFLVLMKMLAVVVSGILHLCQIRMYVYRSFGESKRVEAGD